MIRYLLSVILLFCMQHTICAQTAHWITADHADRDVPNTWIEFHKDIALTGKPKEVYAQIAADTKIVKNGKAVRLKAEYKLKAGRFTFTCHKK